MSYFDAMADYYDRLWGHQGDEDDEIAFISRHAGNGRILEAGIGTGRVAIPLTRCGHRVTGVDNSRAMLDRLAENMEGEPPEAGEIKAHLGGLDLTAVDGRFSLIYCIYHTLFYAESRDEQLAFFRAAAERLDPGGRLIVEAYNPTAKRVTRWAAGQQVVGFDTEGFQMEFYEHQPHHQMVRTGRLVLVDGAARWSYHDDRYLWPYQMDDMAADAGLSLHERWSGWGEGEFDAAASGRAVSLWMATEAAR